MSELSPEGRALLEKARAARPNGAARARIEAGLVVKLGAASLAAVSPSPRVPSAAAPGASTAAAGPIAAVAPIVKAIVVVTLIGAGGAAGIAATKRAAHPQEARAVATAVVHAAPPASVEVAATVDAPAPSETAIASSSPPVLAEPPRPRTPVVHRADRAARPRVEAPRAAQDASSLDEELASLRGAQQALKQGDGARALAALDDLAKRHPTGVLREERLAAQVLALCAAGRVAEAREAGRRFVAEMPASVQSERVRASCAFAKSKAEEQ